MHYFLFNRYRIIFILFAVFLLAVSGIFAYLVHKNSSVKETQFNTPLQNYWFVLHRKSNTEELFFGIPGDKTKSKLVKTFTVKTGIPGERPTPLPQLVGREYWIITAKAPVVDNPETAPYFITLDVPAPEDPPYGPVPYEECNGQCDWVTPGEFGLHGVNGDDTRLSAENPGSSGCVRHSDTDITYLYNLLDANSQIRYYIQDN